MIKLPEEPALIPYFTAGHPHPDSVADIIEALDEGGADVIEVGLPFSEPVADGPTIQNAITEALEGGMTPTRFFDEVDEAETDLPLVVMTYYNLIYQRGEEEFVRECKNVGIEGIIVPDLPVEESEPLYQACREQNVDLIFIIAPTTTPERLERIMDKVSGFIYVQARLGTTGARNNVSETTYEVLERLQEYDVPKAVGFGVSKGEHAREIIEGGADAVVAGSVFVDLLEENGMDTKLLRSKTRELKEGALSAADNGE